MPVASAVRSAGFDRGEVQRATVSLQTEIKSNNCCRVVTESVHFQYISGFDVSSAILEKRPEEQHIANISANDA